MRKIHQNPAGAAPPAGQYSQAVRLETGGTALIFVSGQIAVDAAGNRVGVGDIAAQATQVFENLAAILAANGATFSDVVKMNTYLTDIGHRAAIAEVRRRYITGEPPASTLVAVRELAHPEWLIEVEVVAAVAVASAED